MAAPSIPHLLSLRGSRVRGSNRGRSGPSSQRQDHDATIQGTDTDAAVSRMSAVDIGLLDDPFARSFVQSGPHASVRRLPIINRGTYTRTAALDALVVTFLSSANYSSASSSERQIVSLGAGTDTRSCRLFSQAKVQNVTYHEIDFPTSCARKLNTVKASPLLRQALPDPAVEADGSWHTQDVNGNKLWCHGVDLRDLPRKEDPEALPGLRTDVPTLVLSECCLCYLESSEAAGIIKWFLDKLPDVGIVLYEPINPDDSFGQTMVSNLAQRGIVMPTLDRYRQQTDQEARLRDAGFETVRNMTIDQVWERWVSEEEKERVSGLESLDEVEEWKLLAGHYVVAWGSRGAGFSGWNDL